MRLAAALVAAAALVGVAATPAPAQDDVAVEGTLVTDDDEPVEGVEIRVERDGEEVGTAVSDADGAWRVDLPETGGYTVTLVQQTLPDDIELRDPDAASRELQLLRARSVNVRFPIGDEPGAAAAFFGQLQRLPQVTLQGLKLGMIIAMAAIGLSLVFGTTRLINFAHGEMVTFGAILAWFLNVGGMTVGFAIATAVLVVAGLAVAAKASLWQPIKRSVGQPLRIGAVGLGALVGLGVGVVLAWLLTNGGVQIIPAAVLAMIGGGALGAVMDRGLWQPLRARKTGLVQLLIVSIGFSLLLRHLLLMAFGGRSRPYLDYTVQSSLQLGPFRITPRDLTIMLLSLAILVIVGLLLTHTRLGKAMRAVSDNRDLAESSGINVRGILLLVWVMGGGLAALGGVFFGISQNVNWHMGFELLLYMFAGVILGGIGTAFGAMIGSLVVGLVTELSTLVFSPEFKLVWALLVLIIVLLMRPEGILGVRERIG